MRQQSSRSLGHYLCTICTITLEMRVVQNLSKFWWQRLIKVASDKTFDANLNQIKITLSVIISSIQVSKLLFNEKKNQHNIDDNDKQNMIKLVKQSKFVIIHRAGNFEKLYNVQGSGIEHCFIVHSSLKMFHFPFSGKNERQKYHLFDLLGNYTV